MESQMRKDVREDCSQILYEDERYMVGTCSRGPDAYNLLVNDAYTFLDRGILTELARADKGRLKSILGNIGPQILEELVAKDIPLEELGWVLAKAKIKDQEEYLDFLSED